MAINNRSSWTAFVIALTAIGTVAESGNALATNPQNTLSTRLNNLSSVLQQRANQMPPQETPINRANLQAGFANGGGGGGFGNARRGGWGDGAGGGGFANVGRGGWADGSGGGSFANVGRGGWADGSGGGSFANVNNPWGNGWGDGGGFANRGGGGGFVNRW